MSQGDFSGESHSSDSRQGAVVQQASLCPWSR